MSVEALTWVLGPTSRTLDAGRRMVLVVLADYAGEHGFAWPSMGSLAEKAGCSRDTVRRTLNEAVACGWLRIVGADDPRAPDAYRAIRPDLRPKLVEFAGLHDATPLPLNGVAQRDPAKQETTTVPDTERTERHSNGVATGSRLGATRSVRTVEENPTGCADFAAPLILDQSPDTAKRLVAGFVDDYRACHGGLDPPRPLRSQAGKAAKALLGEGYDADVLAACLGVIARENKAPTHLALIVGDYYSEARSERPVSPSVRRPR